MNEIIYGSPPKIESEIKRILFAIHMEGPISGEDMEVLSYCKKFHADIFDKYENRLAYLMGLFYKTGEPENILEEVYSIFANSIKEESGGKQFTPFQGDAYKKIEKRTYFSFSAPTSAGKSYLFRELILENGGDIVIMVPSRALIAEYMYKVAGIIKDEKGILLLPFIENVNTKKTRRRIYILTPERGVELFRAKDVLNITLFLFDEAQISEEKIRGMQFDTFVRRSNDFFPHAKKVFAHPFIRNPGAQLEKHGFNQNADSKNYNQLSVGKIHLSYEEGKFSYFSPWTPKSFVDSDEDVVENILKNGGTVLIFVSKTCIYENRFVNKYEKYVNGCSKITDPEGIKLIDKLRDFIGAVDEEKEKHSSMLDMMERGIVIHHGSIPLKARYIIEDFVKGGYAKICFSTATLLQGINMPFDAVWVNNFKFEGISGDLNESWKILSLKNLIGRAGRNRGDSGSHFDYGYVIIEKNNVKTFSSRLMSDVGISPISRLEMNVEGIPEDSIDIHEAFRKDGFDDELYLPKNQILRLEKQSIDGDIEYLLNNLLLANGAIITGTSYQSLGESGKTQIRDSFKRIYLAHLRRDKLESGEQSVLSTSIALLLWRIQGKTFKEIVGLRHSYITKKKERLEIRRSVRDGTITNEEARKALADIRLRFSQPAATLPDKTLRRSYPLFSAEEGLADFSYDKLIYDTYDYLDKVLLFSLTNPIAAAFHIYLKKTGDVRAKIMENHIRYGTNDSLEIMLLRYGFAFEDIEWIKNHVEKIDEEEIVFKQTIEELNAEKRDLIKPYV